MSGVRDRQEVSGPVADTGATGAARVQTQIRRFAAGNLYCNTPTVR